ncbi:COP1-interacting protein 4 [Actinidia rufa]|uniref:COP1-interacting protein 4 n=1 Tax=Actinidia rufa TaxID=165716 RepID=A0A7J0HDK5_9ERIC|nr:COP1-interacting protein 4 [Actinidia rufa]
MAKFNRESDSDVTPTTSSHNTVFIDTNLDTHLATIVSDTDTVYDLKRKIVIEHPKCFPNVGEIKILALKVKRNRNFYHLSDSMLVKSAFDGVKKSWFLSVDASSLHLHGNKQFSSTPDASNQLALIGIPNAPSEDRNNHLPGSPLKRLPLLYTSPFPSPGSIHYTSHEVPSGDHSGRGDSCNEVSKDMEMEVKHVTDDPCKNLSSNSNWRSDFEKEYDLPSEGNKILETCIEHKDGNSKVRGNDVQCNNSTEGSLRTGLASKKKRKSKKKSENALLNFTMEDNNDSIVASGANAPHIGIVDPEFPSGKPVKESDIEMANMDVSKEPCKTSLTDTNTRSDSGEIPGTRVECKNMSGDVHCNGSLVEASKSRSADKKKRKRAKGAGNLSEEDKTLLSEFSKETSQSKAINPENHMENKLTEPPEDVHLLASSSIGKKRKRKDKLPRDQVVAAESLSLHDVGRESIKENVEFVTKHSDKASDEAVVSGQNVEHATLRCTFEISKKQKLSEPAKEMVEVAKLPSSSIGIDAMGPDTANEGGKSDAPESGAGSVLKRKKKSKKHHSTNVNEFFQATVNEVNNLKKDVTNSGHENIVHDGDKIETSHLDKTDGQNALPPNCDPKMMLSEKCAHQITGEADVHSKAVASAKLNETNTIVESGGSKRMKKCAKKSVAAKQVMSSMEHPDNSASYISPPLPHFNEHLCGEDKKEESILSETKRTKTSKPSAVDTSFVGGNGESDILSGNEAESLPFTQGNKTNENAENITGNSGKEAKKNHTSDAKIFTDFPVEEQVNEVESLQLNQINMTSKNAENIDEKSRKKIKKNQNSAANSLPDLPINEQGFGGEELSASSPSKTKMKTKSVKTSSKSQLTGQGLELEKNHSTEHGSLHTEQTLRTVDSPRVPSSDTLNDNSVERPLQCDVDGNTLKNHNIVDANCQIEVSKHGDDRINFKDYFVPGEHKHEASAVELAVDKVSEAQRSDRDEKAKKNDKKLVVPTSATSSDLYNSVKSNVNQGNESRCHGVKVTVSQDVEKIKTIPQEPKRPGVFKSSKTGSSVQSYSKENHESAIAAGSSSKSSAKYLKNKKEPKRQPSLDRHHVTVSKASNKKMCEVVNSSRHEKSLLATPGAIFKDWSSSEDESRSENSDSSTKTPSDNSSSSSYSEGESKSSLETPRNGTRGVDGKDGWKSITKSQASVPKNITMDMILKSSSRFKKAKIVATQSQIEDAESQPVDFVPDSQPNL